MEIFPLGVTQIEWSILIRLCQDVLGYSPTRGIDSCHLTLQDAAAPLALLDCNNKPLEALRNPGGHFHHMHVSFIGRLDDAEVAELAGQTDIKLHTKEGRREWLVIMTASMNTWREEILRHSVRQSSPSLRAIMNHVLKLFEQAGFREIFSNYSKQHLTDETFILV
jgi:hypothetical protein